MAELRYDLDWLPSADQLAFIESSLRASFKVTGFRNGGGHIAIEHEEPESADSIRDMTRRFVFIGLALTAIGIAFGPSALHAATCTGANPCNACKNCSSCKRCAKEGGTCGVCRKAAMRAQ